MFLEGGSSVLGITGVVDTSGSMVCLIFAFFILFTTHLATTSFACIPAAGAGAILVNPWNVNDLAHAIEYALSMGDTERRERHRQNYMHVTIHTAQVGDQHPPHTLPGVVLQLDSEVDGAAFGLGAWVVCTTDVKAIVKAAWSNLMLHQPVQRCRPACRGHGSYVSIVGMTYM